MFKSIIKKVRVYTDMSLLYLNAVDHQELIQVLLSLFGHAYPSKPHGYKYKNEGSDYFLDVQLDRLGGIENIIPSGNFPCEELSKIENQIKKTLIDNQNPRIGQRVAFSTEKVDGYFQHKDFFQIIPVPENAPKPGISTGPHPFLLQFSYFSCPDRLINVMRRSEKAIIYIRFLNLLLNTPVFLGPRYSRKLWVLDTENRTSELRHEAYMYPGLSEELDQYSPNTEWQPIKPIPFQKYYSRFPTVSSEALAVPDNLENSLDLVFRLDEEDYRKFFMACSWYYQAITMWHESDSSSFVALVNAIECLTDKPEQCPECNQSAIEGIEVCHLCDQPRYRVTKKFKEFLKKYVPFLDEQFPKAKGRFYEVRSQLSHGLELFARDLESWHFIMKRKAEEEDNLQRDLRFITKIALYNWVWNQ